MSTLSDNFKPRFSEISAEHMTFLDWLLKRHNTTPTTVKVLCIQTGKRKDYETVMAWYRKRYRYEMQLSEELNKNNPFLEEENNNDRK